MIDATAPTIMTFGYFDITLIQDSKFNEEFFYDVQILSTREQDTGMLSAV